MSKDNIQSITEDFKALILKCQKDFKNKDKAINNYAKILDSTKKDYILIYAENLQLKKKLKEYENYYK